MKNLLQFKKNIHIDPYSSKSKILKQVVVEVIQNISKQDNDKQNFLKLYDYTKKV
jgi:hypothetical protein